jgi:hypothetical protein
MDESTEETQARQAAALSGEIDQEVGENGVLVSGGGADARVLRSQVLFYIREGRVAWVRVIGDPSVQ